jgi:hypothetical protein
MVRMGSLERTAGPHRGHIRATNDQIAVDNNGHSRPGIYPAHRSYSPTAAGHRDRRAISDTEEVTGCRAARLGPARGRLWRPCSARPGGNPGLPADPNAAAWRATGPRRCPRRP